MAGDFAQKRGKQGRTLGWDGVPCGKIGVVDALFRIFVVGKNVVGDAVAIGAIFGGSFGNGLLGALPVQVENLKIVHSLPPVRGKYPSSIQTTKRRKSDAKTQKNFFILPYPTGKEKGGEEEKKAGFF